MTSKSKRDFLRLRAPACTKVASHHKNFDAGTRDDGFINRLELTDLAKRCELLPTSDHAAASGNAMTFARHLGPFYDSLRGMEERCVSFASGGRSANSPLNRKEKKKTKIDRHASTRTRHLNGNFNRGYKRSELYPATGLIVVQIHQDFSLLSAASPVATFPLPHVNERLRESVKHAAIDYQVNVKIKER